jgi:uncharacterized membrane protein YdbT with pleckstrin-like domain
MIESLKSLIKDDERVINHSRVHWIVFVAPITYLILSIIAAIFFHPLMGGAILFMALYPAYNAVISYIMTHLVLTDQKVLAQVGFLTRDLTQMKLERIENAYLEEPIIGRYLGYSTVIASGVGSGQIAVPYVTGGDVFIKQLESELEKQKD